MQEINYDALYVNKETRKEYSVCACKDDLCVALFNFWNPLEGVLIISKENFLKEYSKGRVFGKMDDTDEWE